VSYLGLARTLLLGLLLCAVTTKVIFYGKTEARVPDPRVKARQALAEHGFEVAEIRNDNAIFQTLRARAGGCEMSVSFIAHHGWERDTIWRMAQPGSQVLFLYKGKRYPDQPSWVTFLDYYLSRAARLIGAPTPLRPVVGVIGSPECRFSAMPWLEDAS
jgi:hypothetical protein